MKHLLLVKLLVQFVDGRPKNDASHAALHVTRRTSHVTRHTSHVTRHASPAKVIKHAPLLWIPYNLVRILLSRDRTRACAHTNMHAHVYTCVCICTHTHACARHIRTHIHTHSHTHTYTQAHTHIIIIIIIITGQPLKCHPIKHQPICCGCNKLKGHV